MLNSYDQPGDIRTGCDRGDSRNRAIPTTHNRPSFLLSITRHEQFLRLVGIECSAIYPRMTRDFQFVSTPKAMSNQRLETSKPGASVDANFGQIEMRVRELFVLLPF